MILFKKTRNEINITQPCLLYYILFVTIDNTVFICDFRILNEGIVKVFWVFFYASKMWFIGNLYQLLLRPRSAQLNY